jgi:hypothetical protein
MAIEKKFLKALTDVVYIAFSLMQKWSILLKEVDKERVLKLKNDIMCWMKNFQPSSMAPTDIYEI